MLGSHSCRAGIAIHENINGEAIPVMVLHAIQYSTQQVNPAHRSIKHENVPWINDKQDAALQRHEQSADSTGCVRLSSTCC